MMSQRQILSQLPEIKNRYIIQKQLGEGAFATVYLATQVYGQEKVALKCINLKKVISQQPELQIRQKKRQLLETQISLMYRFNHQNVVRLIEVMTLSDYKILVLEYCQGGCLFDEISNKGKFSEDKAFTILHDLIQGFSTIHKNNIIHRDFKTENILIKNGVYKIADFGLARAVDKLTGNKKMTLLGTRYTMAPEVIARKEYNSSADMWSLGVVLFEVLTGKLPYNSIKQDTIDKSIDDLNNMKVSPVLVDLIQRMLTIDQQQRLKWKQLYHFYNQTKKTQPLKKEEQPICKQIQIPSPNPCNPQPSVQQPQRLCLSAKQKLFIGEFDPDIASMISITKACKDIVINTISSLQGIPEYKQIEHQKLTSMFCILILSQILQFIDRFNQYLNIPEQNIQGCYSEILNQNTQLEQFNLFSKQMYNKMKDYTDRLTKQVESKNWFNSLLGTLESHKLSDQVMDDFQVKYMPYCCSPKQHIEFTRSIFKHFYEKCRQKMWCEHMTIIRMNKYVNEKYPKIVQEHSVPDKEEGGKDVTV